MSHRGNGFEKMILSDNISKELCILIHKLVAGFRPAKLLLQLRHAGRRNAACVYSIILLQPTERFSCCNIQI